MPSKDTAADVADTELTPDPSAGLSHPSKRLSGKKANIRILPKGDGKVATGEHDGFEFTYFARGERPDKPIALEIAQELEDRGFVEIEDIL